MILENLKMHRVRRLANRGVKQFDRYESVVDRYDFV